jgi:6-phosphogluconolactonase/glucosamine-6-phosphate isomerase/deaminase
MLYFYKFRSPNMKIRFAVLVIPVDNKSIYQFIMENVQNNTWFSVNSKGLKDFVVNEIAPDVLPDEKSIGRAMFDELQKVVREKQGDVTIVLLGGRGGQALHRLLGEKAKTNEIDDLLSRLNVFTQDALAPLRMGNSLSFVRDFERLLGEDFFQKVKSFSPMFTETADLNAEMKRFIERIEELGGIDLFFLGFGPEANDASHLCYIKPNSNTKVADFAGVIPISSSILEHHISKFKAGGSEISIENETECRNAKFILTLGPAAILSAKRIVQSIVDASTAPAKVACYKKFVSTTISDDAEMRAKQLDENPGLWLRLHPNFRSLILPDVLVENK